MNDDSSSRIAEALRDWINGARPGARLPSTRELVAEHRASPVTVQRALRALTAQGLIETRAGVGTFVRAARTVRPADYGWQTAALRSPQARIAPVSSALRSVPHDVIPLHSGYPDRGLLPERLVRAALARAARTEAAIERAPVHGLPELQSWFARELADEVPAGLPAPSANDVLVVPGSQSGLSSIFRALVARGQPLLVESPTYWGAILAAQRSGVRMEPVPSGPAGPDPGQLARSLRETGARVFYAQPSYANPTGAQWSPELRSEVLGVVREHGAFLVEDDWAHDFGITTAPTPVAAGDDDGHVIYLRSLTKSISPAIRVAAVIARGPARERILADRTAESMYVSSLLQGAALDIVTQPARRTHLRSVRQQLRERRDLLVEALRDGLPEAVLEHVPAGGLNLWLRMPDGTDVELLAQECRNRGLAIAHGNEWFPAEPAGPFVRLNYSGPEPSRFPRAVGILAKALRAA
jgi:DNA-binding transcriptional MocR family regulator